MILLLLKIIDSLEIVSNSDEINFTTNEDLEIVYETIDGFYGTENFTYVVHYNSESDSAEATLEIFLETQLISISKKGRFMETCNVRLKQVFMLFLLMMLFSTR